MEKIMSTICAFVLLVTTAVSPIAVNAQSDEPNIVSGVYEYQVLDSAAKTAAIRKVNEYGEMLSLPQYIDGYKIVKIGAEWNDTENYPQENDIQNLQVLKNSANTIKTISIPEGIQSIGDFAFSQTPNLVQLKLPKSLKEIGFENFMQARKIKYLVFPGEISVVRSFFDSNLDKVVIRNSLRGYFEDYHLGVAGLGGKIKKLVVNGKGYISLACLSEIVKIEVEKSVGELFLSSTGKVTDITVKNKKTKLLIDGTDVLMSGKVRVNLGKIKRSKKGKYTWSKPSVRVVGDKKKNVSKKISYILKYRNEKGKHRTKKVTKNKITKLKTKSGVTVTAEIKL